MKARRGRPKGPPTIVIAFRVSETQHADLAKHGNPNAEAKRRAFPERRPAQAAPRDLEIVYDPTE